jgi:hypothetical protein
MFVNREDILILKKLSTATELISVETIPVNFRQDFQNFFFGKTLTKIHGADYVYPHDIKSWVKFMFNKYKD